MWKLSPCAIALAVAAVCAAADAPKVVTPGVQVGQPPSDAVVLFDGKDLSQWRQHDGSPAGCAVADGVIVCKSGSGDLYSRPTFRDAQIHLEWREPSMPDQTGQLRGNSGVYLHGRYEIQILDSYNNPTYFDGQCGAIYSQVAPLVNACRPPLEWQSYDIVFHAPKCSPEGGLIERGNVTVFHNGVLVQDHVTIRDIGRGCIDRIGEPGPLMFQDHSAFAGAPVTEMRFRNIWFRPLDSGEKK